MQAEKILSKLSGGQLTDRAYLVEMITKYGRSEKDNEEVKKLGKKLYSILIENGLNEKEEIDSLRLLKKADNYLYGDRTKEAIELLKVLESQENWKFYEDKTPIYYFNNDIEAKRFEQTFNKEFLWAPSIKNEILTLLVSAYIEAGNMKEAESTFAFLKKINPVSFAGFQLEARLLKEKNIDKEEEVLKTAFKYGYTINQFAELYSELAYIKEKKDDLASAYALMIVAKDYSDALSIEKHYSRVVELFNSAGVKLPELEFQEAANKVDAMGYPLVIDENMFNALCQGFISYLKNGNVSNEGKELYKTIISSITGDDELYNQLQKIAEENDK